MEKLFKIKNVSNKRIKLTVAINHNMAPGLFLEPNQFCLSIKQMTAPTDKQIRSGFLSIDEDYENVKNLELGKAYDSTILDSAAENAKEYVN